MAISGSTFTEMVNKQRGKNIRKDLEWWQRDRSELSEDFIAGKIQECLNWMPYVDEPWKSQMFSVYEDWKAGNISALDCWSKISDLSQEQTSSTYKQRRKNIKKSSDREYDLMMQLGSLNYLLGAVRQIIINPDIFEEIENRISQNGGINSLHDLEHILDDWHDEIERELETYR